MRKKKKGTTECDKSTVTCDFGTALCEDGTIKCEKKNKGTTEYDKSTVTCNVHTTQYDDCIIKCEKRKIREPPNLTKLQSHVMLVLHNMKMVPSNLRKKKKGTTECDKSTVTYDAGTA